MTKDQMMEKLQGIAESCNNSTFPYYPANDEEKELLKQLSAENKIIRSGVKYGPDFIPGIIQILPPH